MKKILLTFITFLIAVGLIVPSAASAQSIAEDNESITLSPVSRKYRIDAGQTTNDKLTIVNDGKTDYDFIVHSRPYSVQKINGNYDYSKPDFNASPGIDAPKNADAYGWVRFTKTKYHITAGSTVDVSYSIAVPGQAAPGGHYGVIFAETQPPAGQESGNSVVRKKRVGSLIYATVNGQFNTAGHVESTSIPFWQLQPPLRAESSVKNDGNSDFTDDTVYTVKDIFGNIKYKEAKQYTILPQTVRKMTFEWKDASWFGFYKLELEQTVLNKKSTDSGYVLIAPRYLPILLLVVALIGGGYAWFHRKKNNKKKK